MADPAAPATDLKAPPAAPVAADSPAAAQAAASPAASAAADASAAAPVEAAPLATDKPTLMERFDAEAAAKEAVAKPAEPAAAADAKPAEKPADAAAPAEAPKAAEPAKPEPPAPIDYSKLALPEALKPDDAKMTALTGLLQEARVPAEAAQKLIDMHGEAMTAYAAGLDKANRDAFVAMADGWEKRIMADPELGGSGHVTALRAAARMRDLLISNAPRGSEQYKRDLAEFTEMDRITRATSHPAFMRILHNAARWLDEGQAENAPTNIGVPKDIGKLPGRGGRILYDHPRSQPNGGAA